MSTRTHRCVFLPYRLCISSSRKRWPGTKTDPSANPCKTMKHWISAIAVRNTRRLAYMFCLYVLLICLAYMSCSVRNTRCALYLARVSM